MDAQTIGALIMTFLTIVAGSSVLSAWLVGMFERRKKKADAADKIMDAAGKLAIHQQEDADRVRKERDELAAKLMKEREEWGLERKNMEERIEAAVNQIRQLEDRVRELEKDPLYRVVMHTVPDPIFVVTVPDGNIHDANLAAVREYKYRGEELVGRKFADFFVNGDCSHSEFISERVVSIPRVSQQRKNGASFHVSLTATYFKRGDQDMAIVLCHVLRNKKEEGSEIE